MARRCLGGGDQVTAGDEMILGSGFPPNHTHRITRRPHFVEAVEPGILGASALLGLLVDLCALSQSPRTLVNVQIPPDDEVSRVSRADLFLENIGRGMRLAGRQPNELAAWGLRTGPPGNPGVIDDEQTWFSLTRQGCQLLRRRVIPRTERAALFGQPGK